MISSPATILLCLGHLRLELLPSSSPRKVLVLIWRWGVGGHIQWPRDVMGLTNHTYMFGCVYVSAGGFLNLGYVRLSELRSSLEV